MEHCPFNWADVVDHNCSISHTYIRPDAGIATMPWLYSSLFLALHLPLVLVRVLKWNVGQWWSLVMAAFSLSIVSLTYASTQWDPNQIYAWQPITLIGDLGAVVQVLVLVIEQSAEDSQPRNEDRRRILGGIKKYISKIRGPSTHQGNGESAPFANDTARQVHADTPSGSHSGNVAGGDLEDNVSCDLEKPNVPQWRPFRWDECVVIAISASLLVSLVILQLVAIRHINLGLASDEVLKERLCSPAFQIGSQVYDLACNEFPVTVILPGTACIEVDGDQHIWLTSVRAVLIVDLILETLDLIILILVKATTKFQGARMKRPWFSIFMGVGSLCAIIAIGVSQAQNLPLPHETGELMRVAINGTSEGLCMSQLEPGGLRGTVIAWSDGVFAGLGWLYSVIPPS